VEDVTGSWEHGWRSTIASSRYRAILPAGELRKFGHDIHFVSPRNWVDDSSDYGSDYLLIVSKILETRAAQDLGPIFNRVTSKISEAVSLGIRVVVDFCDDYFDHPSVGAQWRRLTLLADICVASTPSLAQRVSAITGVPTKVIGDPLGSPRGQARVFEAGAGDMPRGLLRFLTRRPLDPILKLIWYGGTANWAPMSSWAEELAALRHEQPFRLTVVTKTKFQILSDIQAFNLRYAPAASIEHVEWTEAIQWELVAESNVVLVPSSPEVQTKLVKSANRIADALNLGRYVIATPLPAYLLYKGSVNFMLSPLAAMRHYLSDPAAALAMIERGMVLAREHGDTTKIGEDWADAVSRAIGHVRQPGISGDAPGGPAQFIEPANAPEAQVLTVASLRVAVLAVSAIPTVQLRFLIPFDGSPGEPAADLLLLTEQDLTTRFGKERESDAARTWLLGKLGGFAPTHLVFCRYGGPHATAVLSWARQQQRSTILHIDDDLFEVPNNFDQVKLAFHRDPQRLRALRELAVGVDLVHTANAEMVERLRNYGLINDYLAMNIPCAGDVLCPPIGSDSHEFRLGYMGGGDHGPDFQLVVEALVRLLDDFPQVVFELFGAIAMPVQLAAFGARIRRINPVGRYREFMAVLAERRWHVGLCPLLDSSFNQVKTHIKWVEYTSVGAAVIASRGTVYDRCCSNGQGLLVENDSVAWYQAVSSLISDNVGRLEQVRRAQHTVSERYSPAMLRNEMVRAFSLASVLQVTKWASTGTEGTRGQSDDEQSSVAIIPSAPVVRSDPVAPIRLHRTADAGFLAGGFGEYGTVYTTGSRYTVKERRDLYALLPHGFLAESMLEVGCADGKNLRFFAHRVATESARAVGVDICRNSEAPVNGFEFHHTSAEVFFDGCVDRFDLILVSDVLEHVYNPWKLLGGIRQHLTDAGLLLLSVPNLQNLRYIECVTTGDFAYESTGLMDETHIRFFSQATLTRYLNEAGFSVIDSGWRPDGALANLRGRVERALVDAESYGVELVSGTSVKVTRKSLDRWFGQQILLCAKPA
jgi:2-polyprenyl-3-methyl-5-hydroxy-6-metoxy-1,4-benzoquinol methylase